MKKNKFGQAEILTEELYKKIKAAIVKESHKLFFDIAYYTGERWGAIAQLKVSDVYSDGKSLDEITFTAPTRKDKVTRQVPVHPILKLILNSYSVPNGLYLFPGYTTDTHISFSAIDQMLRRVLKKLGIERLGISTHSTRRGFITQLSNKGIPIKVIQSITGHKSLSALSRYIEVTQEQKKQAIALL